MARRPRPLPLTDAQLESGVHCVAHGGGAVMRQWVVSLELPEAPLRSGSCSRQQLRSSQHSRLLSTDRRVQAQNGPSAASRPVSGRARARRWSPAQSHWGSPSPAVPLQSPELSQETKVRHILHSLPHACPLSWFFSSLFF